MALPNNFSFSHFLNYSFSSVLRTDIRSFQHICNLSVQFTGEVFLLHLTLIATSLLAYTNQTFGLFFFSYYKHIRNTLQFVVANLSSYLLIAAIHTGTDTLLTKIVLHLICIVVKLLRNRQDNHSISTAVKRSIEPKGAR